MTFGRSRQARDLTRSKQSDLVGRPNGQRLRARSTPFYLTPTLFTKNREGEEKKTLVAPIASPSTPARWVRGGDYGQLEAVLNETRMLGGFGNLNFGLKVWKCHF